MTWFEVDRHGLAKLVEARSKGFVIFELVQNAWDTSARWVNVTLKKTPGRPVAQLVVEDDAPEGFLDLRHAFTLFAESEKKKDAKKRGRFNLGEKLVLSLCTSARISTTSGTVLFDEKAGRSRSPKKTERGTVFDAEIRMTREEYEEILLNVQRLIPPEGVETWFNGVKLSHRAPVRTLEARLPTEVADDTGTLRRTTRKTTVSLYDCKEGEFPSLYEGGIPVVEIACRWHVDVQQKVPLNMDRDNVTAAYRTELLRLVLNEMHPELTTGDAEQPWVSEAAGATGINKEAAARVAELQFGPNYVALDPSDRESAEKAQTKGFTVIGSRAMPKDQRARLREFGLLRSSSDLFPTPRPFGPEGVPAELIPTEQWTSGMSRTAEYTQALSERLLGLRPEVRVYRQMNQRVRAAYVKSGEHREVLFSLKALGRGWFDRTASEEMNSLLLHEFAHEFSSSHLHEEYYQSLERLGAKLAEVALTEAGLFDAFRRLKV